MASTTLTALSITLLIDIIIILGIIVSKDYSKSTKYFKLVTLFNALGSIFAIGAYSIAIINGYADNSNTNYKTAAFYTIAVFMCIMEIEGVQLTRSLIAYVSELAGRDKKSYKKPYNLPVLLNIVSYTTVLCSALCAILYIFYFNKAIITVIDWIHHFGVVMLLVLLTNVLIGNLKKLPRKRFIYLISFTLITLAAVLVFAGKQPGIIFPISTMLILLMYLIIQTEHINMSNVTSVRNALEKTEELNRSLNEQYEKERDARESLLNEKTRMDSLAAVYNAMHYINLDTGEFEILGGTTKTILDIVSSAKDHELKKLILEVTLKKTAPSDYDRVMEFNNLHTLKERLKGKRIVTLEAHNDNGKWRRHAFVRIGDINEEVAEVLHLIRDIDEEKNRELELMRSSFTDSLTGVSNRNAYVSKIEELNDIDLPDDMYILVVDVNNLKLVNDSIGHSSGDKLIIATAAFLKQCISDFGTVYRIGGDEFACIINSTEAEFKRIVNTIHEAREFEFNGEISTLNFSMGYVNSKEIENASIKMLSNEADRRMYLDKKHYYQAHPEINRRHI